MPGLVLSDAPLLYHRPPLQQGLPGPGPLAVQVRLAGGKNVVTIGPPGPKRRPALDRSGIMLLRRALLEAGFRAVWR